MLIPYHIIAKYLTLTTITTVITVLAYGLGVDTAESECAIKLKDQENVIYENIGNIKKDSVIINELDDDTIDQWLRENKYLND